ncbi:MAG: endolytic transglycosylase MltG [Coprothermobacter sp.]|nr:endolytic transglycosylase MltG [Coprothermobacter sp.]
MDEGTQNTPEVTEPTTSPVPRGVPVRAARVVGVLLITAIIAGAVGWVRFTRIVPVEGPDAYVDVHPGDSVTAVSERVFALGMTSGPQALRWYWRLRRGGSLREGRYVLKGLGDMEALYQQVASGSPLTARVTFPEGYTVHQMAARLQEQAGITADEFLKAARDGQGTLLEGHLFPDTYEFLYAGDATEVVARMLGRFADMVPSDWGAQAAKRGLTGGELVTVASIVEREARYDADRPLVASVIFNRLADKMLLQMDATLGYVLPSHDGFYSYEELKDNSPYNTYVHPGLPPTPICNPGLASLNAAAHAPASTYYYFLAKPDGHCVFARTFAEHARNMRLYLPGGN